MIIVMIHWKIVPDRVDEFLEFWRKEALINDRRGLVGELLTEAHSTAEFEWITWQLTGCEGKYRSFINIGYWDNAKDVLQAGWEILRNVHGKAGLRIQTAETGSP